MEAAEGFVALFHHEKSKGVSKEIQEEMKEKVMECIMSGLRGREKRVLCLVSHSHTCSYKD